MLRAGDLVKFVPIVAPPTSTMETEKVLGDEAPDDHGAPVLHDDAADFFLPGDPFVEVLNPGVLI